MRLTTAVPWLSGTRRPTSSALTVPRERLGRGPACQLVALTAQKKAENDQEHKETNGGSSGQDVSCLPLRKARRRLGDARLLLEQQPWLAPPPKPPKGPLSKKELTVFSLCGSLRDLDGSVLPPNCTLPSVVTKTWSEVLQRKRHDAHIVSYCTLHMSILMGLEVQSLRHEMGHTARHAGT